MSDFHQAMEEAKRLAATPEGKELAARLQQLGGMNIQQVLSKATAGDPEQAKNALSALMQNPETRKILEQLGNQYGK